MTASPLGLYPVVLIVIARTRIDAGKLLAVRRALCASEYGGVTRILVWCPETVTQEVSAERFASVARTEGSAPRWHLAVRLTVFIPCRLSCWSRMAGTSPLMRCWPPRMGGTTSTTPTVTSFVTGLIGR